MAHLATMTDGTPVVVTDDQLPHNTVRVIVAADHVIPRARFNTHGYSAPEVRRAFGQVFYTSADAIR